MDVSPDGSRIVSASSGPDGAVKLWDARSGAELATKGYPDGGGVQGLRYVAEGEAVAAACRQGALLFLDAETLEELDRVPAGDEMLVSLAVSPDGSRLAVGGSEGGLYLWDARGRKRLSAVRRHEGRVGALAFSPDGSLLASAGAGEVAGLLCLWNVGAELTLAASFDDYQAGNSSITFSPDGRSLISGGSTYRRPADGGEWQLVEGAWLGSGPLLFLPDGRRLLCGVSGFMDNSISLWDVERRAVERRFDGHVLGVKDMALFPGGRAFVSAGDATLRVWDLERPAEVVHVEPHVYHVLFVPGRPLVVTASLQSEVVWVRPLDDDGAPLRLEGHAGGVRSAAVAADGSRLACGTGRQLLVWDLRTGGLCWSHEQPPDGFGKILGVTFSPDGRLVAACDPDIDDSTILVFEAESGAGVAAYRCPDSLSRLAFSPDGRRLAASGQGSIHIRDLEGEAPVTRFPLHDERLCYTIVFTPDGEALVVEDWLRSLSAWDSRSGARLTLDGEHRAAFERLKNRHVKTWVWEKDGGGAGEGAPGQQMMTLASAATGEAVAWLPLLRDEVVHHPAGRVWANRRDRQVYMVALEGGV